MRPDRKTLATSFLLLLMPFSHAGEALQFSGMEGGRLEGQPSSGNLEELEPVVIVGGLARPMMWKVSKGGHVLWVLAQQAAPPGVQWRLDEVESRVAASQLVLYPGYSTVDVDVGFFRAAALVPTAFKTAKNPDKKTLKDVLPPDVYARWRVIKTAYVGRDNDIEEWRPGVAVIMLEEKVGKKLGPAQVRPPANVSPPGRSVFRPLIEKTAKKHKVKIRTLPKVEREVKIRNVKEMLKSFRESSAPELMCFKETLDYLERRIEYANRKASGEVLVDADLPRRENCTDFDTLVIRGMRSGEIPDPAGILRVVDNIELQARLASEERDAAWLAAAQSALAKNDSTFTLLRMHQITGPSGYVAKLRELGYSVEEPE
jgi:hypothetical protein